jgi:hypothetical protein
MVGVPEESPGTGGAALTWLADRAPARADRVRGAREEEQHDRFHGCGVR